jgi:hypothetical protein
MQGISALEACISAIESCVLFTISLFDAPPCNMNMAAEVDLDDLIHIHLGAVNENEPNVTPRYTGGYSYPGHTYTYTAPNHETAAALHHGMNQLSVYGWGYELNPNNLHYTCHGLYDATWIVPIELPRYYNTTRPTGWCVFCGFFLTNPERQNEPVGYYNALPASGAENYLNYVHYACSKSHLIHYSKVRYQASLCLYFPQVLAWALSSNQHRHKHQDSFTYMELIDLFVGLKLSGELDRPLDKKNWIRVRRYCFILRLQGKTTEQMKRKYRAYKVNNRYTRYFTPAFMQTVIIYDPTTLPPPA